MKGLWDGAYYSKFKQLLTNPEAPVPKICVGCRAYRTDHRVEKYGVWDIYDEKSADWPYPEEPDMNISLVKVHRSIKKSDQIENG